MTDSKQTPNSYIVDHATEALAHDPSVGALDITITVEGQRVIATGTIETDARRQAIDEVLTELLPDHEVIVDVVVSQTAPGDDTQDVR